MNRNFLWLAVLFAGIPRGAVFAQNSPSLLRKASPTAEGDGWSGKVGFGYALTYPDYNSGIFQFSEVSLDFANQRILASSETSGTVEGGNIKKPNGVFNAGYDYNINRLRFFVYTNYEFGVIQGLESNTAIGAGARYTFLKFDKFSFDSGVAPIYERTAYADDTQNETLSISLRGRLKIFFSSFDTFYFTWLFMQGLNDAQNQWHAADLINNTVLTHKISLRQAYRWRYDIFSNASAGLAYLMAVFNFE